MPFTVSCDHPNSYLYRLEGQEFADVSKGEWGDYRIDCTEEANGRRYYAIAPLFGCGRYFPTPQEAIRSLLQASACTNIEIGE